jgi:hypothetical protein
MQVLYDDKSDLLYIRFDDRKQEVLNKRVSEDVVSASSRMAGAMERSLSTDAMPNPGKLPFMVISRKLFHQVNYSMKERGEGMTRPEAMTDKGTKTPSNQESRDILDAYRVHLDVWKVQNDNYFKRVQLLMVAVQAASFAASLKFLDLKGVSGTQLLMLTTLAILGLISAQRWMTLNEKQHQYMEFCRRPLRNLEHRLAKLGVPLRYFTLEAHVFGPLRTELPELAATTVRAEQTRHIAEFLWAQERYPDQDKANKGLHELGKVSGGTISFEKKRAGGIRNFWILVLIAIIIAAIIRLK